jgi:hypothetical protein
MRDTTAAWREVCSQCQNDSEFLLVPVQNFSEKADFFGRVDPSLSRNKLLGPR